MPKYQIDQIDQKILSFLVKNARMPFLEIARECGVSGAGLEGDIGGPLVERAIGVLACCIEQQGIGSTGVAIAGLEFAQQHLVEQFGEFLGVRWARLA